VANGLVMKTRSGWSLRNEKSKALNVFYLVFCTVSFIPHDVKKSASRGRSTQLGSGNLKLNNMDRKSLIQNDGYWQASIENALYHKNYKGKNRRGKLIKQILDMKSELIQSLNGTTVKLREVCPVCEKALCPKVGETCPKCESVRTS